jgi:hypothetical protein
MVPEAGEKLFQQALEATFASYRASLDIVRTDRTRLKLDNLNLDTGKAVVPGEYQMADEAYAELSEKLQKHPEYSPSEVLRADIARFAIAGPARRTK